MTLRSANKIRVFGIPIDAQSAAQLSGIEAVHMYNRYLVRFEYDRRVAVSGESALFGRNGTIQGLFIEHTAILPLNAALPSFQYNISSWRAGIDKDKHQNTIVMNIENDQITLCSHFEHQLDCAGYALSSCRWPNAKRAFCFARCYVAAAHHHTSNKAVGMSLKRVVMRRTP